MKIISHLRYGFNLAEVLITLGIIGVVATITLTILIKEYQKIVFVNQLKQTYSILEQGFQKMLADDGVDFIYDTSVFQSIPDKDKYCYTNSGECILFYSNIKKYFKILSIDKNTNYKYKYLNKNYNLYENGDHQTFNGAIIKLENGAYLINLEHPKFFNKNIEGVKFECNKIKTAGGKLCSIHGRISIDVNGDKAPNTMGRDLFIFYLGDNGHLFPKEGKDMNIYNYGVNNYFGDYCRTDMYVGHACGARIIEQDNWKMKY